MSQNLIIANATYNDVPAVDITKVGGGTARFVDTSDADAVASDILASKTAYVNGVKVTGTGSGGGGGATVFEIIPVNFSYDIDELEEHRRRIYLTDSTTSRPLTISGYEIDDDYGHNAVRLQGWNIYEEDGVYFLHCRLYNDGFNAMTESGIITIYVLYASTPDTYDGEVE